eukprot:scaffold20891_cov59-Cyclotella_meneghiniana.AAC.1
MIKKKIQHQCWHALSQCDAEGFFSVFPGVPSMNILTYYVYAVIPLQQLGFCLLGGGRSAPQNGDGNPTPRSSYYASGVWLVMRTCTGV